MAKVRKSTAPSTDLDELDASILKEGLGKIIWGADEPRIERIPTGLVSLDRVLAGGIPRGRMTELYGKEGSCKSLVLLGCIAGAQRAGGEALLIDMENTFDPEWAATNGVDVNRLRVAHCTSGEEAYTIANRYLATGKMAIIGIDSVAQLVPEAELRGEMTDANIGLQARMNAKAMRKLTSEFTDIKNTALVMVNQTRANVNAMGYGPSEITSGGKALPFYMSLRIGLRRTEWVRAGDNVIGAQYQAEVVKAKLTGVSGKATANFRIDFQRGLDFAHDILVECLDRGLVTQSGSWFTAPDGARYQGERNLKDQIWANMDDWKARLAA